MVSRSYPQRGFVRPEDATEVILIRHGASATIADGERFPLTDGVGDPELSPEGQAQAERVAERVAREPLRGLFVSGLRRTLQTAAPLAAATGLEPISIQDLREVNLGEWEGGEFRMRVANRDPIAIRAITEERWDVIPGAESMENLARRVRAGLEQIVARSGPGVAAAVVHGGVIGELCRQTTDSRPFAFVGSDNASITRLVVLGDGRWLLRTFNDAAHLAAPEAVIPRS